MGEELGRLLASLGSIFLAALVCDAIGRRTILPRVTLLIVFGFVAGPSGLDLLPDITRAWFPVVSNMALVMIGFLLGGQLTLAELRERGALAVRVSLSVVAATFALVGVGLWAAGSGVAVALVLGAVAAATAPAATVAVVHETGSDTPFAKALLDIVAIDDAWGLILFSVALALAGLASGATATATLAQGSWELLGAVALGVVLGLPMAALTGRLEPGEPSLYEGLGGVFLCGGIALLLDVSFLLASMTLGVIVANRAHHHTRPFHAIEGIEWPFMVVFFVLAGASLEIEALAHAGGWLALYVVARVAGRVVGAWIGGSLPPADRRVQRWMGVALLPQAGVPLGMALVAAQQLPSRGEEILTVVVSATVLFELVGPVATRLALRRTAA